MNYEVIFHKAVITKDVQCRQINVHFFVVMSGNNIWAKVIKNTNAQRVL